MLLRPFLILALISFTGSSMAIDLAPLWDFNQPDVSEQRFRAALESVSGDDALLLKTQIARAYGLRKDFSGAREILASIEPELPAAAAEVRIRHALELGRTYASAAHSSEQQTEEARMLARTSYLRALELSRSAQLDALSIDAIHMLAFVDTEPADQLKWAQAAMAVVQASSQADARKWEAPIRNNLGYALHQLGRFDEALDEFEQALVLRERSKDAEAVRVARWMVAWTLRAQGRTDEALRMQLSLEHECEVAGAPDPYVYEELEILYRARGNEAEAVRYRALRVATAD